MINLDEIKPENFIEDFVLEDLKSGKAKEVITRCPPEPSGYWHIGHCKAWAVDFETAIKFGGHTFLRMDDTNPTKEDGDFAESYVDDLHWLGYTPKRVIYASEEYFEKIYLIAEEMIKNGDAYVDELTPDEMSKMRGTLTVAGTNSPYRERPKEESLDLFRKMRAGAFPDGTKTLRAKIDMSHPNMNMRDPVMYRIMRVNHYKTGDKWCIYPMYDFAHPLEDALEGVTFSLCDMSFEDHRPAYNWFLEKGWKKPFPPRQIEFAKLNLENVLLGKRHLKRLVNEGVVMGWDDPRFLTIVGMKRRGYTAQGVKNFIKAIGVAKADSVIPISQLEHFIREDLNTIAPRAMVVLDPLKVVISNYEGQEEIEIENNPNDEVKTYHKSVFSKEIYIEREDFALVPPPKYNRLTKGGMVRLKGAYIIVCDDVVFDNDGNIDHLICSYVKESKSGDDTSGLKPKGTIHFVSNKNCFPITIRKFKNLIKDEFVDPGKALNEGKDIFELLNQDSMTESMALSENFLASANIGDKFQFMRKGYFSKDKDSTEEHPIFNFTISLKDSFNK